MLRRNFFKEEDGSVIIEYLLLAAAAIIGLGLAIGHLYGSMGRYLEAWVSFFGS